METDIEKAMEKALMEFQLEQKQIMSGREVFAFRMGFCAGGKRMLEEVRA